MSPVEKKNIPRNIDPDLAAAIDLHRNKDIKPPDSDVIDFRDDEQTGRDRTIEEIPLDLLYLRKNNGRISSEVSSYEKKHGPIDEKSKADQKLLKGFLLEKDKPTNVVLEKSLYKSGQRAVAIITADGFLINGNRRRCIIEKLSKIYPNETRFQKMRVVILPGENDPGGPPTLLEIEQVENRLQLQQTGKSDYEGIDKALAIRRKLQVGMTLEEQVGDDPEYVNNKKKGLRVLKRDYLQPLECIDRYLHFYDRPQMYDTIEERWYSFIDYSHFYEDYLQDDIKCLKNRKRGGIEIDQLEVPLIEEAAFKLIRKKNIEFLENKKKMHVIMRDLKKYLAIPKAKEAIIKIADIDDSISEASEKSLEDLDKPDISLIDKVWSSDTEKDFSRFINIANKEEAATRLTKDQDELVEDIKSIVEKVNVQEISDKKTANNILETINEIVDKLNDISTEIDKHRMNLN